jgi:hypothetical protein
VRPDDIEKPVAPSRRIEDRAPLLVCELRFDGVRVVLEVREFDERALERPSVIEDMHGELFWGRFRIRVDVGNDFERQPDGLRRG